MDVDRKIERALELLREARAEMDETKDKSCPIPSRGDKPETGDRYWHIDGKGKVKKYGWTDNFVDDELWENRHRNHMSMNKSYVVFMLRREQVLSKLFEKSVPFKHGSPNNYLYLHHTGDHTQLLCGSTTYSQRNEYYFTDRKELEDLIDEIGEREIIRYYFMAGK